MLTGRWNRGDPEFFDEEPRESEVARATLDVGRKFIAVRDLHPLRVDEYKITPLGLGVLRVRRRTSAQVRVLQRFVFNSRAVPTHPRPD